MYTPRAGKYVGRQRFHKCVVCVCGDVNSPLPYRNYDGGVVKISRRSSKLYDIADFKFVQRGLFGERPKVGVKFIIFAPAYMHCEAKLVQSPPIFSKL